MIVIIIIMVVVGESRGREIGCGDDVPYNYDRTNKAKITNFLMLYMVQGVPKMLVPLQDSTQYDSTSKFRIVCRYT